jgi:hypothetical protein
MWNYLRNLQNKPLHTRKMILYVSTVIVFTLIVLLWVLLLNVQKVNESKASYEGILSPFERIKETFTKMFEQINTTNIPAIPQGVNNGGAINPSNINSETSYNATSTGMEIGTTTVKHATRTPL